MRNVLFVLTASIGLAACFTSDEPLITDEMAVAPYARITYVQEGTDEQQVLIRDGNGNAVEGEPGSAMRFAPVADNLYVAQATSDDAGKEILLYGLIAVDLDAGVARSYKAAAKPGDAGPGLRECDKDLICIDDLDAYIRLARKAYDDGAEPTAVYNITVE
jgi:hypothetical protein